MKIWLSLLFVFFLSWSEAKDSPLHWSANKQIWNRKTDIIELKGNAAVHQLGESVFADEIQFDQANRVVKAKGNCTYETSGFISRSEEMWLNLDTRKAVMTQGRVSNERYSLSAEKLEKVGENRFVAENALYSTCWDCPQAWSIEAKHVDLEFEGYAFMSNVMIKMKGANFIFFPYLVFPVKKNRQSGLIFPEIGVSDQLGFYFVQPYFWAINEQSDMTFGLGRYSKRGPRLEWEGRYVTGIETGGQANFGYIRDKVFPTQYSGQDVGRSRYGLQVKQRETLFGLDQKLQIYDVSDNLYPSIFKDMPGLGEGELVSSFSFTKTTSEISSYVEIQRNRKLIDVQEDEPQYDPEAFDADTVQVFPRVAFQINDQSFYDVPLTFGFQFGISRFTRSSKSYDVDLFRKSDSVSDGLGVPTDFVPGVDPIREANRISYQPSVATTFRVWDRISITPKFQYLGYYYHFENKYGIQPLNRGYGHFTTDFSTQWERVYDWEDTYIPKYKHTLSPTLQYSAIPFQNQDDNHPFAKQIQYAQNSDEYSKSGGYQFDNEDIVPYGSDSSSNINYFIPQGHSLTYGLRTKLIRKRVKETLVEDSEKYKDQKENWSLENEYQTFADLHLYQAVNFLEVRENTGKPFSRFFANLSTQLDQWSSNTSYSYDPHFVGPRHRLSTGLSYTFVKKLKQRVLDFERSVGLGYDWDKVSKTNNIRAQFIFSVNDYIMPNAAVSYNFYSQTLLNQKIGILFQSPSRCWRIGVSYQKIANVDAQYTFDLGVNLTGDGYAGVLEPPSS